jgi:hypothetical protein
MFGGKPGESVPEVDPEDLKALWRFCEEQQAHSVAAGVDVLKSVCKPGANVEAKWYR